MTSLATLATFRLGDNVSVTSLYNKKTYTGTVCSIFDFPINRGLPSWGNETHIFVRFDKAVNRELLCKGSSFVRTNQKLYIIWDEPDDSSIYSVIPYEDGTSPFPTVTIIGEDDIWGILIYHKGYSIVKN